MNRSDLPQPAFNLPRGRFTDALVAVFFIVSLLQLAAPVSGVMIRFGFIPFLITAGQWRDPLSLVTPFVSQFLLGSIVGALFNTVMLLIVGRYVEKSIGPLGLGVTFVAGAYGGALARLALTPGSMMITAGAEAALFAIIGAYLMLYGIPRAVPIASHYARPVQIAMLAGFWSLLQLTFMLASGVFEISDGLINPLGGLLVGALIGQPLLRWRWRKA